MKKVIIALLICAVATVASADLIISQYTETDSGTDPKGIELWNTGVSTIDFSVDGLDILVGVNGGALSSVFTLSVGTLAAGDVMVIGTAGLLTYVDGLALGVLTEAEPFTFNGNDALQVQLNSVVQDTFGNPGQDLVWTGGGVSTANQNIQLLTGITTGNTVGWTDPSTRFETVSTTPSSDNSGFGIAPVAVPEPATMSLLGLGALAILRRKMKK
jgi:PEP-CTERM motif-containing protein